MDIQKQHEDFDLWWEGNAIAMMCEEDEALKIWQAAKAKAVPEGYVVVPKLPTENMINSGLETEYGIDDWTIIHDIYQSMLEAVEQNQ